MLTIKNCFLFAWILFLGVTTLLPSSEGFTSPRFLGLYFGSLALIGLMTWFALKQKLDMPVALLVILFIMYAVALPFIRNHFATP